MSLTLAAINVPPTRPSLPPFRERLRIAHNESVAAGPSGPIVLFMASFSSAAILCGQGLRFLYRRCRGYA